MKSAVIDSFIAPEDYASLSEKDFAIRFLEPMFSALKKYSGTEATHDLHLRMTVRELTDLDISMLSEEIEETE